VDSRCWKNLIGKYVRNWKHATVVCFTALSGKSPGVSEKNHNDNPVMTVGLPAEIKWGAFSPSGIWCLAYWFTRTKLYQAAWRHVQRDKILINPALRNSNSHFTLQDGLQSFQFQCTAAYRSFVFSGLFREIIPHWVTLHMRQFHCSKWISHSVATGSMSLLSSGTRSLRSKIWRDNTLHTSKRNQLSG